ncbi:MAG: V/A-type H+/Na+-transporting ATPase subunit [Thermosediminibacterales bacterium]|nr:V/A-type H+/Na+-transporting ATPase subunit [Thermosediminibacterales bacterium]MDK2836014.1 V/A-type H+/Na+-transporting ATPase subunit [Thermosediminibacterales bacterium]
MAVEEIKAIKEAEKEAEKILADAKRKAAQIVKEAKEEAENLIADTIKNAEAEGRILVQKAEESSKKEVDGIKSEYEQKWKAMEQQALKNMDKAVNFIVERIVKSDGNY